MVKIAGYNLGAGPARSYFLSGTPFIRDKPHLYAMQQELYFDISDGEHGGSLYRLPGGTFSWQHSTYDEDRDETKIFTTAYASFAAFWQMLTQNREWYYQHPLFVHPEVRAFVGQQLESVDWSVQGDFKWQQSHQRQWTKVLSDRGEYYKGK